MGSRKPSQDRPRQTAQCGAGGRKSSLTNKPVLAADWSLRRGCPSQRARGKRRHGRLWKPGLLLIRLCWPPIAAEDGDDARGHCHKDGGNEDDVKDLMALRASGRRASGDRPHLQPRLPESAELPRSARAARGGGTVRRRAGVEGHRGVRLLGLDDLPFPQRCAQLRKGGRNIALVLAAAADALGATEIPATASGCQGDGNGEREGASREGNGRGHRRPWWGVVGKA
mmetsp:Transcript_25600/g.69759  ORF Transcript_25600/g.69759 Transcript_25600/m.69759 type:complete len:227 (-) Transcript_25600:2-682(-)